jgi:hypothetical protein
VVSGGGPRTRLRAFGMLSRCSHERDHVAASLGLFGGGADSPQPNQNDGPPNEEGKGSRGDARLLGLGTARLSQLTRASTPTQESARRPATGEKVAGFLFVLSMI